MIAVSFALPAESSDLVAAMEDRKSVVSGEAKAILGRIDNKEVAILHTGVGRKSCEQRIDNFLTAQNPRCLISSGFAGAIGHDFEVGDLILAENFSDQQLLSEAVRVLRDRGASTAKLFTAASVIDPMSERIETARAHDAAAVDMETKFIAKACAARGIPMLSARVISDTVNEPFPAPPSVLFDMERQRTNFVKLSVYLISHPRSAFALARFARQIARARKELTGALLELLRRAKL